MKSKIIIIIAIAEDHCESPNSNKEIKKLNQFKAFRKIKTIPINKSIIKNLVHPGKFSKVTSLLPKKTPTKSKNETTKINNNTIFAITSLITATNLVEAITKKPITKATIELIFFLVTSLPSTFSVPNTLVLSKIANTIVKTNRKGKITSYTPTLPRKVITPLNIDCSTIYKPLFNLISN